LFDGQAMLFGKVLDQCAVALMVAMNLRRGEVLQPDTSASTGPKDAAFAGTKADTDRQEPEGNADQIGGLIGHTHVSVVAE
jgi:hypothetical protein